MFGSVRNRFPEHKPFRRLRSRYLATGLTRRRLIRQAVSVFAASVVGIGVMVTVRSAHDARDAWGESRPVVLTTTAMDVGDVITGDDLRVEMVPRSLIPDGAITIADTPTVDTEQVLHDVIIGRRMNARLGAGEMVTDADVDEGQDTALGTTLGPGEAAVTIDPSRVPPGLEHGDQVDIYGPPDGRGTMTGGTTDGSVRLLAHDARVIGVDDTTVTLAVENDLVVAVLSAADDGRVSLVISR